MLVKTLSLFLIIFALGSCATSTTTWYEKIDPNEKTISFPNKGDIPLKTGLKRALRNNGFKIVVYDGGLKHTGQLENTGYTRNEHSTRYLLDFQASKVELLCMSDLELFYEITIIDTKNGQEVVSITGKDCGQDIWKKLDASLKEKDS